MDDGQQTATIKSATTQQLMTTVGIYNKPQPRSQVFCVLSEFDGENFRQSCQGLLLP